MHYTFGTSERAAQRLQAVADFFNPLARDFIGKYLEKPVKTAVDLGCGPGFTTAMLGAVTSAQAVYGLDLSEDFLALARKKFPAYNFLIHDVTAAPLPVHGDAAYARFLLAHLGDPCSLVNLWADELAPGGLLFVEEVEDIFTEKAVFKQYLEINTGLVSSQGANLYAGREIKTGQYTHKILLNEPVYLPVPNWQAASWFYPNTITIWQTEEYVQNRLGKLEIDDISSSLKSIMESGEEECGITWLMRRIVLKRSS